MTFRLTPAKLPRLSEREVIRACLDLLALRGYFVVRVHSGTFKSVDDRRWIKGAPKGTPDYACLHARRPGFLLEFKRPGAKPSPEQDTKHFEIRIGYQLAIGTVDSVEGMLAWLEQHERNFP